MNREESAMKLIFLMKILKLRNSVCPIENHSEDFDRKEIAMKLIFLMKILKKRNSVRPEEK